MAPRKNSRASPVKSDTGTPIEICFYQESGQSYRPFTDPRRIETNDAKKGSGVDPRVLVKGVPANLLGIMDSSETSPTVENPVQNSAEQQPDEPVQTMAHELGPYQLAPGPDMVQPADHDFHVGNITQQYSLTQVAADQPASAPELHLFIPHDSSFDYQANCSPRSYTANHPVYDGFQFNFSQSTPHLSAASLSISYDAPFQFSSTACGFDQVVSPTPFDNTSCAGTPSQFSYSLESTSPSDSPSSLFTPISSSFPESQQGEAHFFESYEGNVILENHIPPQVFATSHNPSFCASDFSPALQSGPDMQGFDNQMIAHLDGVCMDMSMGALDNFLKMQSENVNYLPADFPCCLDPNHSIYLCPSFNPGTNHEHFIEQ